MPYETKDRTEVNSFARSSCVDLTAPLPFNSESFRRCSSAGRLLSQLHDGGRVQCAKFAYRRRWKYRDRLVCIFFNAGSSYNTGAGAGTLVLNNGESNTAVGTAAMLLNTIGSNNVGVGITMLLNEFLKERRKVEEQQVAIAALKNELQAVQTDQKKKFEA